MAKILNIQGTEIDDLAVAKLAAEIKTALPDDYTLVIGAKPFVYDIDGVLIGNGNIFAVECKDWRGEIKASSYGTWRQDGEGRKNPMHQARTNAAALAEWLRKKGSGKV